MPCSRVPLDRGNGEGWKPSSVRTVACLVLVLVFISWEWDAAGGMLNHQMDMWRCSGHFRCRAEGFFLQVYSLQVPLASEETHFLLKTLSTFRIDLECKFHLERALCVVSVWLCVSLHMCAFVYLCPCLCLPTWMCVCCVSLWVPVSRSTNHKDKEAQLMALKESPLNSKSNSSPWF